MRQWNFVFCILFFSCYTYPFCWNLILSKNDRISGFSHALSHMWPYRPKWVALILGHNTGSDDFRSACQKYWFSVFIKIGCFSIFLFENITFNGQMWCFKTVSGILNCNCCNSNAVVCQTNFLNPISYNGTLHGSQIDLSITF